MAKQALTIAALITLLQAMNQEDTVTLYNPEDGSFVPLTAEDLQTIQAERYVGGSEDEEVIAKNVLVSEPGQSENISILCLNSTTLNEDVEGQQETTDSDAGIAEDAKMLMQSMDNLACLINDMPPSADGHTVTCASGLAAFVKNKAETINAIAHGQRGIYSLLEVISADKVHDLEYQEHVKQQKLQSEAEQS